MKALLPGKLEIAYEEAGSGPPLLFIHGWPHNRTLWSAQVSGLSTHARCIAPDLRGFGGSTVDGPYSMQRYADDLVALLDALGIDRAVVCGLSMGGYLAFALYRLYPEMMLGLVLADTRAEADTPEQVHWRFTLAQRTAAMGPAAVIAEMLPKLLAPTRYDRDPDFVARVKVMLAAAPVPGIIGALMALAERPDSTNLLPAITIPTLIIVGADDVLTTTADAERMATGIAGAELVVIPDAGHLSNLEQPDRFTAAVERFAERLVLSRR